MKIEMTSAANSNETETSAPEITRISVDREMFVAPVHEVVANCENCGTGLSKQQALCHWCERERDQRRIAQQSAISTTMTSLPPRYVWAHFDAPELPTRVRDSKAIARAREVATSFDRIVLAGPAGVGKTVLAACILRAQAETHAKAGLLANAYALSIARAEARYGQQAQAVADAVSADVLALDDLGSEPGHPTSAIVEIIHERHASLKPVVVTTWLGIDEIRTRYGDGACRRIFEGAIVIHVKPTRA